jgi:hypothetical protein
VSALQDALSWYTYNVANIISTTSIAKKKVDYDDRGAFNMLEELMHSWVGYKLVKVLLTFGLSPKICKTWKVGHRIYLIFFPTLATNNGTLQKRTC